MAEVGVDLGGTKTLIGLVDPSGNILEARQFPTVVERGPDAIILDIAQTIKDMQSSFPTQNKPLNVGVAVAGQVEKGTGIVRFAPNLNWHNYPLKDNLSPLLNAAISVTNDVRAATWGEWIFGAGRGVNDILCLFFGTGIGGGVVSDGHMLEGVTNAAGELGHVVIDHNGPQCTCGNYGCFEALAGGWAIAKDIRNFVRKNPESGKNLLKLANGQIDHLSAKHLFEAHAMGDSFAVHFVKELEETIAAGISGLVNAFNPKMLILGGGIIEGAPFLLDTIRSGIQKRSLKVVLEPLLVVKSMLGENAGVIGAAAYAGR